MPWRGCRAELAPVTFGTAVSKMGRGAGAARIPLATARHARSVVAEGSCMAVVVVGCTIDRDETDGLI